MFGIGMAQNTQDAFRHYVAAAEGGSLRGMNCVASMLDAGQGVSDSLDQDRREDARFWYGLAASSGDAHDAEALGAMAALAASLQGDAGADAGGSLAALRGSVARVRQTILRDHAGEEAAGARARDGDMDGDGDGNGGGMRIPGVLRDLAHCCNDSEVGPALALANCVELLLRRAAQLGHSAALVQLGQLFECGSLAVTPNAGHAEQCYRAAAEQGHARAQNHLGALLFRSAQDVQYAPGSEEQTRAYENAAKWFEKSAKQGDEVAQNNLGICLEAGHGVPANLLMARSLFYRSATRGQLSAMNNLGYLLLRQAEMVAGNEPEQATRDCVQACKLFRQVIDVLADSQARRTLTTVEHRVLSDASYNLARLHESGTGTTRDLAAARQLYSNAADGAPCHYMAACRVADFAYSGIGGAHNVSLAAWYYASASASSSATSSTGYAENALGILLENGCCSTSSEVFIAHPGDPIDPFSNADLGQRPGGAPPTSVRGNVTNSGSRSHLPDERAAVAWYKLAAHRGSSHAAYSLWKLLETQSSSRSKDRAMVLPYLKQAADGGLAQARQEWRRLSPEEKSTVTNPAPDPVLSMFRRSRALLSSTIPGDAVVSSSAHRLTEDTNVGTPEGAWATEMTPDMPVDTPHAAQQDASQEASRAAPRAAPRVVPLVEARVDARLVTSRDVVHSQNRTAMMAAVGGGHPVEEASNEYSADSSPAAETSTANNSYVANTPTASEASAASTDRQSTRTTRRSLPSVPQNTIAAYDDHRDDGDGDGKDERADGGDGFMPEPRDTVQQDAEQEFKYGRDTPPVATPGETETPHFESTTPDKEVMLKLERDLTVAVELAAEDGPDSAIARVKLARFYKVRVRRWRDS